MKKLLVVALIAASFVGMAEARCGKNGCAPKPCRQEQACKPCIRAACIVGCENSHCEGEMPQLCALEPARVDVIKHVDTNVWYTCADRGPCTVIPTQEQVDALIGEGSLPAGTQACTR